MKLWFNFVLILGWLSLSPIDARGHVDVWHYSKIEAQGVVLALHGLNNKPQIMDPISEWLSRQGYDVYRGSLSGHNGDHKKFDSVSAEDWQTDFLKAFQEVKKRAEQIQRPISLVAYSLGAITALSVLMGNQDVHFDSMVLFAPPITTKISPRLVQWSKAVLPDRLRIPSMNVPDLRANDGTSLAAYGALFKLTRMVHQRKNQSLPTRAVIFADPKDELVSVSGVKKWLSKNQDLNWELIEVEVTSSQYSKVIRHLIADPKAVPAEVWSLIQRRTLKTLRP